jgi:hypothetical protein
MFTVLPYSNADNACEFHRQIIVIIVLQWIASTAATIAFRAMFPIVAAMALGLWLVEAFVLICSYKSSLGRTRFQGKPTTP